MISYLVKLPAAVSPKEKFLGHPGDDLSDFKRNREWRMIVNKVKNFAVEDIPATSWADPTGMLPRWGHPKVD
jgi:hypothetical protein